MRTVLPFRRYYDFVSRIHCHNKYKTITFIILVVDVPVFLIRPMVLYNQNKIIKLDH